MSIFEKIRKNTNDLIAGVGNFHVNRVEIDSTPRSKKGNVKVVLYLDTQAGAKLRPMAEMFSRLGLIVMWLNMQKEASK